MTLSPPAGRQAATQPRGAEEVRNEIGELTGYQSTAEFKGLPKAAPQPEGGDITQEHRDEWLARCALSNERIELKARIAALAAALRDDIADFWKAHAQFGADDKALAWVRSRERLLTPTSGAAEGKDEQGK